jgi:hypothetical protein
VAAYPIRSSIRRGGENDWDVENLAKRGMSHDVVLVKTRVPVPCDMVEADLDIKNEQNLELKISLDNLERS